MIGRAGFGEVGGCRELAYAFRRDQFRRPTFQVRVTSVRGLRRFCRSRQSSSVEKGPSQSVAFWELTAPAVGLNADENAAPKPRLGIHRIAIETKGLSDAEAARLHHALIVVAVPISAHPRSKSPLPIYRRPKSIRAIPIGRYLPIRLRSMGVVEKRIGLPVIATFDHVCPGGEGQMGLRPVYMHRRFGHVCGCQQAAGNAARGDHE